MKTVTRLLYIALVSMLVSLPALAVEGPPDPLIEIQKDIASLKTVDEQTQNEISVLKKNIPDKNYVDILEKTNQQLTSAWVPTSISINILEVFIAVIAIATGYAIYLQSSDYKEKLDQDREEYKKKLRELLASHNKQMAKLAEIMQAGQGELREVNKKVDAIISEYKKKLKSATAAQKKEIEKTILELKAEKATLRTFKGFAPIVVAGEPITVDSGTILGPDFSVLSSPDHVTCPECKTPMLKNTILFGHSYTCPSCAHKFTV